VPGASPGLALEPLLQCLLRAGDVCACPRLQACGQKLVLTPRGLFQLQESARCLSQQSSQQQLQLPRKRKSGSYDRFTVRRGALRC
jgi:hypothetical protein